MEKAEENVFKFPVLEMERAESENIELKNLVGFRFHPSDQELLLHYLKSKVFCLPLPDSAIADVQNFQLSPWDLPGELNGKKYFFSRIEAANMSTDDYGGYWVASNLRKKPIFALERDAVIGMRKAYVYYPGSEFSVLEKVEWVMHEFSLAAPYSLQVENWVVWRVYRRNKKAMNQASNDNTSEEPGPSSPEMTSSSTSGITQAGGCSGDLN